MCNCTLCMYAKENADKSVLYFQVKDWCLVTYRYINFSGVPTLTEKHLSACTWKTVVIEASIGLVLHKCARCSRFQKTKLFCDHFKGTFTLIVNGAMLIYCIGIYHQFNGKSRD